MREIRTTVRVRFFLFSFLYFIKRNTSCADEKKSVVISTAWPRSGMRDKLSASRGHATHDTTPAEQTALTRAPRQVHAPALFARRQRCPHCDGMIHHGRGLWRVTSAKASGLYLPAGGRCGGICCHGSPSFVDGRFCAEACAQRVWCVSSSG